MDETTTDPVLESDPPQTEAPMAPPHLRPQSLTLESWAIARFGQRHLDQAVAFSRWAAKQGFERGSTSQWNTLFSSFNNQLVR